MTREDAPDDMEDAPDDMEGAPDDTGGQRINSPTPLQKYCGENKKPALLPQHTVVFRLLVAFLQNACYNKCIFIAAHTFQCARYRQVNIKGGVP